MSDVLDLPSRPRRNRKSPPVRAWHRETQLGPEHLVYPLFIHAGTGTEPIPSMPGQLRLGRDAVRETVSRAWEVGVRSVVLFPAVEAGLKTGDAAEATNPDGLVPTTLRALKEWFPELVVITDIALDPYSSEGHDGLVAPDGRILNDETVAVLCEQALAHARAGADVVSPSDMMDGRIGAIRRALDGEGFTDVSILSYCAKYASSFYGPFRDALDSAPKSGDKKTYQMDPGNVREALRELRLDEAEGADLVMVKPAGPYLDVIRAFRQHTALPVAAYQVSGEYAMLTAAVQQGWLDERAAILESLLAIRRAGADVIFTYFAPRAARWLREASLAAAGVGSETEGSRS
ncbi:MAG TPA: porphobilinogen synthase [Polyangiaceae bacterium LLY-WYZ-14_1]|nr:porphobilinogen synthase [Polyangiaceae bacterium LLY-WYZ-14_1]